ncbi:MAG TPA: Phenylacetic acid catabolic protein [Anaerolineae bacterium]|nr:Phenylacetic acid catabolic protein [Anaerolineae bacterium]
MSATTYAPRYQSAADVSPEVNAALLQFGLALADTKHRYGVRLSEWSHSAPALEASVGCASMTQDELGHARSLFAMLRDLPGAPADLNPETDMTREKHYNPRFLDAAWLSWADVIAANALLDRALNVVFESARRSEYGPLGGRVAKILQEEHFHHVFGESWLARLASGGYAARDRLQAALNQVAPVASAWFGPPDDATLAALGGAGILSANSTRLRETWLSRVTPLLDRHGLSLPTIRHDWSTWNAERREAKS